MADDYRGLEVIQIGAKDICVIFETYPVNSLLAQNVHSKQRVFWTWWTEGEWGGGMSGWCMERKSNWEAYSACIKLHTKYMQKHIFSLYKVIPKIELSFGVIRSSSNRFYYRLPEYLTTFASASYKENPCFYWEPLKFTHSAMCRTGSKA